MVSQVTGLSRNGVSDWVIQRVSAYVLAAYTLCVVGFVAVNPGMTYEVWSGYLTSVPMQIFTMLALLSICLHAWIGMWAIGSDYLNEHLMGEGANTLRFIYQIGCVLIIATYLIWGVIILWGN